MSSNGIGELAEIEFIRAAMRRNFQVSKPILHDSKYDCIVDNKKQLLKIQIKSTSRPKKSTKYGDNFLVTVSHGASKKESYKKGEIDFFALYLMPVDIWYILPLSIAEKRHQIVLSPYSPSSKWNKYKEAWNLLI